MLSELLTFTFARHLNSQNSLLSGCLTWAYSVTNVPRNWTHFFTISVRRFLLDRWDSSNLARPWSIYISIYTSFTGRGHNSHYYSIGHFWIYICSRSSKQVCTEWIFKRRRFVDCTCWCLCRFIWKFDFEGSVWCVLTPKPVRPAILMFARRWQRKNRFPSWE